MSEEEYGSGLPQEPPMPAEETAVQYFSKPEQILDADDQQWGEVKVPEWAPRGDANPDRWILKLKGLSGADRDRFEASVNQTRGGKQKQNYENFRARLIVMCAVDPDGNRIFSRADINRLGAKSAKALDRVFTECNKLNGFSEEDVADMTEGFDDGPNGALLPASPGAGLALRGMGAGPDQFTRAVGMGRLRTGVRTDKRPVAG